MTANTITEYKRGQDAREIKVRTYLIPAPATSPLQGKEESRLKFEGGLLIECDPSLEEVLVRSEVENTKGTALLFASGADNVGVKVDGEYLHYHKTNDYAHEDKDTEQRKIYVRELTYKLMWKSDENGNVWAPLPNVPTRVETQEPKQGWLASWFSGRK